MKSKSALFLSLFLFVSTLSGKIWQVSNHANLSTDFADPNSAVNSASVQAGDTIYVYGSSEVYGDINISKFVILFGPGYFLMDNENTQANRYSAKVANINLNQGSSGTQVSGFEIRNGYGINVYSDGVIISRNFSNNYNPTGMQYAININSSISNVFIQQNFIPFTSIYDGAAIQVGSSCHNIAIENNYIWDTRKVFYIPASSDAIIKNNVLSGNMYVYNSVFANNIYMEGAITGSLNTYYNNLANEEQFGTASGNQTYINMSTVFLGSNAPSADAYFLLKSGSPAIAAGQNGEDCGMFGGDAPYHLSGIPPIPAIHFLSAPLKSSGAELPVNIKVKSHD